MEKCESPEKAVRRETQDADLRWLMDDPRGRRLMMRLLCSVGLYRCTYDPGLRDISAEMLFREGQKNIGYKCVSEINRVCPDTYFLMLKESNG